MELWGPYTWPDTWETGVVTILIGVITPYITGWGPPCKNLKSVQSYNMMTMAVPDADDDEEETSTMMMLLYIYTIRHIH